MQQERLAAFKAHLERHNLCYCGEPRAPGRKRCPTCLEIENQKMINRYKERRAAGLCIQCGERKSKGAYCGVCKRKRRQYYEDQRIGEIRQRLRELVERDRVPLPDRLRAHARFLVGNMAQAEADPASKHWRPNEAACRRYARENPGWEGFILVTRRTRRQVSHRVYLVTRERSSAGRERISVQFIRTSGEVPWRQYG